MTYARAVPTRIEAMGKDDWESVRAIYQQGIDTGNATFETSVPDWDEWDRAHLASCRLVAWSDERVIGWAALMPVSARAAYRGVVDLSIYVAEETRGRGIGRDLLNALMAESEREGIWTIQAGVFPENEASLALHRSCGFRTVGIRHRIGARDGVWRDVVLMERRARPSDRGGERPATLG
jgi:L-amino acid N-acyltransferase YncA